MSAERIQVELTKLVISPNPDFLRIAWETGITAVVLPEFDRLMEQPQNNPHHCFSVGEHTLHAMQAVRPDKCLRLAMLLHDVAKPLCLTTDNRYTYRFSRTRPEGGADGGADPETAAVRQPHDGAGFPAGEMA